MTHTSPQQGNNNTLQIVNTVLVAGVLVLGLAGAFGGGSSDGLTKDDVKSVVTDALKAAPAAQPTPTPTPPQPQATAPSKDEILAFYKTAYVLGPKDAKVTIFEFSDFQCPFCKRFSTAGTIDTVMKKYDGKVNKVFVHFPLNNIHPFAQKAAESAECVAEQIGEEGFYAYGKALFADGEPSKETILKVAATIKGVDVKKLETCMNDGKYTAKVQEQQAFGVKLGITGTPGSIIFNHDTGETQKVSGAVPPEAFDGPMTAMVK